MSNTNTPDKKQLRRQLLEVQRVKGLCRKQLQVVRRLEAVLLSRLGYAWVEEWKKTTFGTHKRKVLVKTDFN